MVRKGVFGPTGRPLFTTVLASIALFLVLGGARAVRMRLAGFPLMSDDWRGLRGVSFDAYSSVLIGIIGFAMYGLPTLLLALRGLKWPALAPTTLLALGSVPFGTGMICNPLQQLIATPVSLGSPSTQLIISIATLGVAALPVVLVRRRRPTGSGNLLVGVRPSAVVGTTLLAGGAVALLSRLGPRPGAFVGDVYISNYCDVPLPVLTAAAFAFAAAWDARSKREALVGAVVLLLMQGSWFSDLASLPLVRPSASVWFKELGAHVWFLMRSGYLLGPIVIPLLIMPASRSLAAGRLARMLPRSPVGSS